MKRFLFVLQSGFAIGNWYWDNFIKNLYSFGNNYEYVYLDSFIKTKYSADDYIMIGIGHSLGFTKLVSTDIAFDILFGIQAFIDFCGFGVKLRSLRMKALEHMHLEYMTRGDSVILEFYEKCGIAPHDYVLCRPYKRENVLEDFKMLYDRYKIPDNVFSAIVYSKNDSVVPYSIIQDNFMGLKNVRMLQIDCDKHNLGYEKCDLLMRVICGVISDRF